MPDQVVLLVPVALGAPLFAAFARRPGTKAPAEWIRRFVPVVLSLATASAFGSSRELAG